MAPRGYWKGDEFGRAPGTNFCVKYREVLGHMGEFFIKGSGMDSTLWLYWMVFDQSTEITAPDGEKLT